MMTLRGIVFTTFLFCMAGFAVFSSVHASDELVESNTRYAVDLYQQLRKEQQGNIFISPYSMSLAFAMAYGGARGETAQEIAEALHFNLDQKQQALAFQDLSTSLMKHIRYSENQLDIANALFLAPDSRFINDEYRDFLKQYFDARTFSGDINTLNQWVASNTQQKIKKILDELPADLEAIILNAIYFKGIWASQFDSRNTREEPFYLNTSDQSMVSMMHQTGEYTYLAHDLFQAVAIPYQEQRASMVILLPNEVDGLEQIENEMTEDMLDKWLREIIGNRALEVELSMPRMKMEMTYRLKKASQAMGMRKAFQKMIADFRGMGAPIGKVWIGDVVHKTFLEVNEEGSEAAAVTGIVMMADSISPPPVEFRADHPFLFMIVDNETRSVLFLGRFTG